MNKLTYFILCLLSVSVLNVYFFTRYNTGTLQLKKISLETSLTKNDVLIYANSATNSDIDFSRPFIATGDSGKLSFDLGDLYTRQFRIYIGTKSDSAFLRNVCVYGSSTTEQLIPASFVTSGIFKYKSADASTVFFANESNGYFKLKRETVLPAELYKAELLIILISVFLSLLFLKVYAKNYFKSFSPFNLKIFSVYLFLFSIFLPLPVFNVTFMFSFLLVIRDFDYKRLLSGKLALAFLGYFIFFMLNNFLLSSEFNVKLTETLLPFFFLPFYFACIPTRDYINVFSFTGFLISLYLFSTAAVDFIIYKNVAVFSFDAFSKYLHPVYFSYLLFFSVVYIQTQVQSGRAKTLVLVVLVAALVCCGSKLIIMLTLGFYAFKYLRKRLYAGIGMAVLIISAILLFPPTRVRFMEVFNLHNVSILSDHPLKSIHDPRLNGLTIRLIIWQESLGSLQGKDIFWGKGVDRNADKFLEKRLSDRGLEVGQTKYDPHNQFIATFYKMGILGLSFIMFICVFVYRQAFKAKSELLLTAAVLFSAAMLTESVLQRAVGIYFFISILLLLSVSVSTTVKDLENSNTRNQGNT